MYSISNLSPSSEDREIRKITLADQANGRVHKVIKDSKQGQRMEEQRKKCKLSTSSLEIFTIQLPKGLHVNSVRFNPQCCQVFTKRLPSPITVPLVPLLVELSKLWGKLSSSSLPACRCLHRPHKDLQGCLGPHLWPWCTSGRSDTAGSSWEPRTTWPHLPCFLLRSCSFPDILFPFPYKTQWGLKQVFKQERKLPKKRSEKWK